MLTRSKRLAATACALLALGLSIEWLSRPAPAGRSAPPVPVRPAARGWFDAAAVAAKAPAASPMASTLPAGLALDGAGQLRPGLEVRLLFDRYLRRGAAPLDQRAADLRRYLDATLPASARPGAQALATRYLAYARAHDARLATQGLATDPAQAADAGAIARLATWQQERARLRQQLLGMELAQAWFEGDDAQLGDALVMLRQQAGLAREDPDDGSASNRLRAARLRTAATERAEREELAGALARATTPYAHPQP